MNEVKVTPRAERSLKKLDADLGRKLLKEFVKFVQNEDWYKSPKVKKLEGASFYRYKTKNHRIFFDQYENIFEIFDVRKRMRIHINQYTSNKKTSSDEYR